MSIPSGRNNTLVAESDLQAAYAALDERLLSIKNNKDPLLQECVASLQKNLDRIVQPISDEAFHVYVKRNNNDDDGMDETTTAPAARAVDDDEEYDEEDLLDPEALQRVKELREAARAQAASVQAVRRQVLDQAVELAQRQVRHWLGKQQAAETQDATTVVDETTAQRVREMQASLVHLRAALERQTKELPRHLSGLQETVAVVEESLNRPALTQTDQAIREREEDAVVVDLQPEERSPEALIADFLGQ
jgi:hypothetical protein